MKHCSFGCAWVALLSSARMLSMSGDLLSIPLATAGSAGVERRTATAKLATTRIRNLRYVVAVTPRAVTIGLFCAYLQVQNAHTNPSRQKDDKYRVISCLCVGLRRVVGPGGHFFSRSWRRWRACHS